MIRGLADLKKEEKKGGKPRQDYYAGGEKSGIAVSDPRDPGESIMRQAREQSGREQPERAADEIDVKITLYANGFRVDDGDFRDYAAPENQEFMTQINQGRVPREIFQKTQGRPVSVGLEDKRKETYVPPPPPPYIAFSGEGQSTSVTTAQAIAPVDVTAEGPVVDASQPTTTIQFRFHNGQRKTLTVNLTTRIEQLYEYAMLAAPVEGSFELLSGFPPKPLAEPSQTVQAAGVAGSAVIQRLS
jgi:UBX domain-containing protein 1